MARLTRVFGIVLVVLGAVYFVLTGSAHKTALIPAWFGVVLFVCGLLANTEDLQRRMLWMHIAVTVGLVGFLFPAVRAGVALSHRVLLTAGQQRAAQEEALMALVCGVFTALCVRNFVAVRVARRRAAAVS